MSRAVFGETDSPRLASLRKRYAARATVKKREPRLVCWDGGGRCTSGSCEIAEGCAGPVPNPRRARGSAGGEGTGEG